MTDKLTETNQIRAFPFDVSAAVEKALSNVPVETPFVIIARTDTRQLMVAGRVHVGSDLSFSGYLTHHYKGGFKNIDAGAEVVWTPDFF